MSLPPRYPDVQIRLTGKNGNAFLILGTSDRRQPMTAESRVSSSPSSSGIGAYFRHLERDRVCAGRLVYTRWTLDVGAPGLRDALVRRVAHAYVGLTQAWTHPHAMLAVELPTHDSIRKADFGEVITSSLFSYRLGLEVPIREARVDAAVSQRDGARPRRDGTHADRSHNARADACGEQVPLDDLTG